MSEAKEERVFYMTAANGMSVRVPESKLESWLKGQEEIRNGTYKRDEQAIDEIMLSIFGETGR